MSVSNIQTCGDSELFLFKRRRASGDTELEIAPFLLLRDIAPLGKAGVRRKNPIRAHPDDNLAAHRKFDTQRAVMGQTMGQESKLAKISIFFRYLMEFRGGQGGIRTRDTVSRIHTFQACAFNHSATSPWRLS